MIILTSAALSINLFSSSLGMSMLAYSADNAADTIEDIDYSYVGTEHAYDPMAEIEAEEAEKKYRENASYEANKVVFSVIDHRSAYQKDQYLSDNSNICCKYDLHNVKMVYESVSKAYENEDTATAYEVFYEAETSSDDIWSIVDQLNEDEGIASAEPVYVWKKSAVGEPVEVSSEEFARETHFSILETDKVWKSLKNSSAPGAGTVIAVIDTGVDYNHKDLADNIWINPGEIAGNGIDDDGNGYIDDIHGVNILSDNRDPMDDHGHGTHVAGAITMTAGNGGGVGLAYGAKIMCIKAGSSSGTFASYDVAKAIKYAVDNGADVINMSFGGEEKSAIVEAALKDAAEYAVLVASAGNDGLPTSEASASGYKNCKDIYPAGFNTVIGVMAADNTDHFAPFSNWDYISGKGCEYEIAAPGSDIYSTLPDNRYAVWSGTSLAAANVAAAAAIIRSEYPNKSRYDARFIMGQLINASSSRATAEPAAITTPAVTTVTTTVADSVTTVPTTTVMSDDPLVNADVDGKDGIDKDDFAYMLKGLVGLNELGGSKGDVNCDGTADMFDAVSILRLCDNKDSVKDIMASPTIRKEYISFEIPKVDISEDGDYKSYTFKYNSSYPFKAVTGQLKYNGKAYSGEFKEVKLLDSTSDDIIYEFNPENGKIAAYCADNENSGSFTISVYEGKEGSYSIDTNSLKFYDENGKEYLGYNLGMFNPELNYHSASSAAAVGTPSAVAVYDKKVEYPRLNIMDSLTVKAHPELRIESVEMLETADISNANNGDGIVQPGETVGLGISIWNSWAAASDVKVKIEAVGADGKANPYVEVLDSNISFGDIKAYSGTDNGLTYSDGKIKSITAPIRIKVKDNAPNDGKMEFKITLTAKNGFDTTDTAVYTSDSDYSFIVQRIRHFKGGDIKEDIVFDTSMFWMIDGDLNLSNGATMTIKPGTQLILNGSLSGDGLLVCKGTELCPISIKVNGEVSIDGFCSYTEFTRCGSIKISKCDHCKFIWWYSMSSLKINEISNSIIYNNTVGCDSTGSPYKGQQLQIPNATNCLFNLNYSMGEIKSHNYNVYVKDSSSGFFSAFDNLIFDNNSNNNAIIYGIGQINNIEYLNNMHNSMNYYRNTYSELHPDDSINNLTLDSSELERIYPFMTEAFVTNARGERVESIIPGEVATLHLKFNRDMAIDVQPQVTLGRGCIALQAFSVSSNYDDFIINGNWISNREWTGKISFDMSVLEKKNAYDVGELEYTYYDDILDSRWFGIRSEGAIAADDRWLVTGNDGGGFGFTVVNPATIQTNDSEVIKLTGKGGAGCNQLTWQQDEMATLAGYNIYRSVENSNNFTKLNKSLLSNEDLQYTDTNVVTGQKYYYYITTVDTDFNESKPSNTVECIPLDSEKPQIKHTPVTYSEPNKSIVISADVSDNVKVDNVSLFYKYSDENEWNDVKMRNTSGSNYQKVFSAYEVQNGQIQYYIEATDGINKAYYGTEHQPYIIKIISIVSTTTTTETTTTKPTTTTITETTTTKPTTTTITETTTIKPTTTTNTTATTTTAKPITSTTTTTAKPTTTSTTVATTTNQTTTTTQPNPSAYILGDVDNNSVVDAVDASKVLAYYARISTKQDGGFSESQKQAADVNKDGIIDAVDASKILAYYAYLSTTKDDVIPLEAYIKRASK